MLRNIAINAVLKMGLVFPLAYAGLAAFVVPDKVLAFWPLFIANHIHESVLVFISGVGSFALIIWLCSRKKNFAATLTTTALITLVGIFNVKNVPFLMELSPLFFIGLALSLRYYPRIRVTAQTRVTPLANITIDDEDLEESIESVVESDIHAEHDQHIFISKQ